MAYYDAISNAIAARGNALAQSAQQQGQVYGNLASNLGQLPFQAMQAGQRRRALEVETQHRAAQTQTIQDELDFQKEMSAAISGPGTEEEIKQRAELVLRKRPEKWLRYHELLGQQKQREQQQLVAYNATRQNTPGTVAPQGGYALPMPTQGETVPGGGLGNAFEPVTPMAEQMVHPTIQSAYGPLNAQTTAQVEGRKEQTAETTAARQLQNQKSLAEFTSKLRPAPRDYLTSQATRDPRSSTGWRWMQWDQEANDFSIPGNEAPPPMSTLPGAGQPQSQLLGWDAQGNPVQYSPGKGGGGKVITASGGPPGPITPKVSQAVSDKAQQSITGALNAMNLMNQLESLTPKVTSETPVYNYLSGAAKQLGVKAGFSGEAQQFEDLVGQLRVSAQDIIKGIPSNFDVQTFIATLPQLTQGTPRALNNIRLAKEKLTREFTNQIAYFKGSNKIIPDEILDQARNLGIDVDAVPGSANPWGGKTGTAAPAGSGVAGDSLRKKYNY